MDRRIKAILVANNIYDLTSVEIIDYDDGVLEIVKNDKPHYISLNGEVFVDEIDDQIGEIIDENPESFKTKSQDEKIAEVIKEAKPSSFKVTVATISTEIDDDLFSIDEKIDENIDDFDIDLDDVFNFDNEVENAEEKQTIAKKEKNPTKSKKRTNDDDLINIL
ncbi:MAG: hypothetical protein K9J13_11295 [Saprospiraceae bacterium]|nr:hypothetical protein [Saprospiraceae bacterium]